MPIYEYVCKDCEHKFEALRPMSKADAPIECPFCGGSNTARALSLFSAVSKGAGGETQSLGGSSGCSSCPATTCAGCSFSRH